MSSSYSTAARIKPSIPANFILSAREFKHFRRWQRIYTTLGPAREGNIPTATEYEDFHQWLKMQDSGYFSDTFDDLAEQTRKIQLGSAEAGHEVPVAVICQHAMHPVAADQMRLRCPVCVIDVHLQYVRLLTQALENAGGRAPSCTLVASDHQDTVYSAWQYGKICALSEVSELERMADKEDEWSAQNPELKVENLQTARKALDKYWSEMGCSQAPKISAAKNKSVVFAQDTDFEPGRPQAYFWKRSPRYESGKYTLVEQLDNDDGVVSEDSEDYNQAATVFYYGSARGSTLQDGVPDLTESTIVEEDDGDSDWEDLDSDDEIANYNDEDAGDEYVCFEFDEQTDFIVFDN